MGLSLFSILALFAALALAGVLLAGSGRRRLATWGLLAGLAACLLVELGDLAALSWPAEWLRWKRLTLVGEGLVPSCWLFYAAAFGRSGWRELPPLSRGLLLAGLLLPLTAALLPLAQVYYSPDFADERVLFLGTAGYWYYLALMALLVPPLVQLERTLGALGNTDRWQVKFELVGAGAVLAALFIYSGQGLLYRSLDMNLLPVRSLGLGLGVGLILYSRLRRGDEVKLRLSRQVAFGSLVILAVGLYLVGLGLAGEGMRYLGLPAQRAFVWALALLAGTALVLLFLAEATRRRILVFLHKHFYRQKYDYRQHWLDLTRQLAGAASPEALQGILLEAFIATFRVRGAALYLAAGDGAFYLAQSSALANCRPQCPSSHPLGVALADKDWVVRFDDDSFSWEPGEPLCITASIAVPLRFDEELAGFLLLGPRIHPWEKLSYEDFDLMKVFGRQAGATLVNQQLTADLAATRELAAIGKVAAFVVHDLKNQVSGLSLVVDNARNYIDDPEFQTDMLETLDGTVRNMNGLIARLKNLGECPLLTLRPLDLREVATEAVRLVGSDRVEFQGTATPVQGERGELQKVVLNLLLNAVEAGGTTPVRLTVQANPGPQLRVSDSGCGMSEGFIRQKLFKPFETTKKKGFGIGLYQVRQIVEAHHGRIEVESREGAGTTFSVWLPAAEPVQQEE